MQFVPSEHQSFFPFIRLAEASDEMMGEGIANMKNANTIAAAASKINFIANLPSEGDYEAGQGNKGIVGLR